MWCLRGLLISLSVIPSCAAIRLTASATRIAAQVAQLFQAFNRLGQEAGVEEGTGIGLMVANRPLTCLPR